MAPGGAGHRRVDCIFRRSGEEEILYCVRELGEEGETRGTCRNNISEAQMHELCEARVDRGLLAGEEISKRL
jgi:hypothetical protein